MKGIVGKKLGMTRIFDAETGGVTAVTVIEAAPCPVVLVKTVETDGYEAVQVAYEAVAERKITRPELGHLNKHGVAEAYRHLVEFRGATDAVPGEAITVEAFAPGDKVKVSGIGIGKGFAGTIKRHNFHRGPKTHGSHNIRKPGSITPHTHFEAEIYVLSKEEGGRHTPFFNGYRPQFYFRTTDVTGNIKLPEGQEMVMPGDNTQFEVELIQPIAMDEGLRFAVREGGRTVGAGVVTKIVK